MHVLHRMANPAEGATDRSLDRALTRRVATYARPYGTKLVGFVVTIVLEALLALAPPFLFKAIIDNAIPERDTGLLSVLAALVVGAAVASTRCSAWPNDGGRRPSAKA